MKEAHWSYVNRILEEDQDSKGLWRYLKGMRKDKSGVSPLTTNGKTSTTPQEKAETLNQQFSSVFTKDINSSPPPLDPIPSTKMPPISVTEHGVFKLLDRLNPRKASGADDIPSILLKTCAKEIAPMLTFIIQQTINDQSVPADWRRANVTPIFKKGSRAKPENYRPVSLTSICCKIAEHVIVSQTMAHMDNNNHLSDNQHGFRRKRSCESQLIITSHELAEILNRKGQVDVAVLDFSKAFDKVPHRRLLQKLGHYNIDPNVIGWIEAFLKDRTQRVAVDGCLSSEAPVLSGVPQGTVLGPMLFLIFINDIGLDIFSRLRLFADDCLLFREIKSIADSIALQQDLDKLVLWSHTWGMAFNIAKCNVMSITNKKNGITFDYAMEGTLLVKVTETVYLGVTISDTLQWKRHIDKMTSSADRLLGFLWRTMHKCPKPLKEKAFNSIVRSKLSYAQTVWDPYQSTLINKIEKVQRRGARFVNNTRHSKSKKEKNDSPTEMMKKLKWTPMAVGRKEARLSMMYKIIHEDIAIPTQYLPPPKTRSSRQHHNWQFQKFQATVDTFKFAFVPRTSDEWNTLPSHVVEAKTLASFKSKLRGHLRN